MKVGSNQVRNVKMGGVNALKILVGGKLAWIPTLKITATSGLTARDELRTQLTAFGLDYTTATEIPFEIDVAGSTVLTDMFIGMANLSVTPRIVNTDQVVYTNGMFRGCKKLEHAPYVHMNNVVDASYMYDDCQNLMSVPFSDSTNLKNANYMFRATPKLLNGTVKLRGRHPFVTKTSMIDGSGLTQEPWYTRDGVNFALDYSTNFDFGQTTTINLDGKDGWAKYSTSGQVLVVESTKNVTTSKSTSDGYYYPLSSRTTYFRSDNQMVSVRWTEPWKAEASGFFLSGYPTYNANDFYLFDGSTSPKLHYSNGYWNYTGPQPNPGQLFTITKEVTGTVITFRFYIDESLVQTINTSILAGSRNNGTNYRRYGLHATFRRYLWGDYPGARINYFEAKDI